MLFLFWPQGALQIVSVDANIYDEHKWLTEWTVTECPSPVGLSIINVTTAKKKTAQEFQSNQNIKKRTES